MYDSVSSFGQLEMAVENLEGFGKPRTDRQKSSKTAVGCETGSGRKTVISGIHSKLPHVPGLVKFVSTPCRTDVRSSLTLPAVSALRKQNNAVKQSYGIVTIFGPFTK